MSTVAEVHPAPMLRVEVNGSIERRPAELHVLVRDLAGRAVVSHMRPQLLPGEALCERRGQIPIIVQEATCPTCR